MSILVLVFGISTSTHAKNGEDVTKMYSVLMQRAY